MKNKTKTYLLLVLVLAIWGVIGYRILAAVNPSEPEITAQNIDVTFRPKVNSKIDTFSIKTVNRDPFLGTLHVKKQVAAKKIAPKIIEWKPIVYHGKISKESGNKSVFILSIEGHQYLVKSGQVVNDIKLISGNTKQIVVSYKGQRKTVLKT
ncbi:hypothetical protein EYD45_07525 [Hyunsoonleella flava]|uniref:Type II secretion system protein GspC N-terminal domain-containing protein n=1 Tax=Hyunsoonleella flava TaxID=2527939 RepID=A0A4Q9FEM6_9FLAO|nr:hypothetical protein [Hyunsoonleella flava]TBN04458.1 hypothetical protein EYD45_07525 [Hyunsoonleella flava]